MTARRLIGRAAVVLAGATVAIAVTAGSATADHKGPGHWSAGGGDATIYYVDFTGSRWPVGTTVSAWNNAKATSGARLSVIYRTSCPSSGSNCINVQEYTNATSPNPGCDPPKIGCAIREYSNPNLADHYVRVRVYLNNSAPNTTTLNRQLTCHEIGHSLGLEHSDYTTTCMNDPITSGTDQYPGSHDFNALGNKYNHSL